VTKVGATVIMVGLVVGTFKGAGVDLTELGFAVGFAP
jgi:hypothetical protein